MAKRSLRTLKNISRMYLRFFKNTPQKWKQCIAINQVYHEHQWDNHCVRVWQVNDQTPIVRVLFTTFSDFLSTGKTLYNPLSLSEI